MTLDSQGVVNIAVVGQNISTALIMDAVSRMTPPWPLRVETFEVAKLKMLEPINEDHWMLWLDAYGTQIMGPLAESYELENQAFIFTNFSRRFTLEAYLNNSDPEFKVTPSHFALRRRILSVGIWNDFTPPVWDIAKGSHEPDISWPLRVPLSYRNEGWLKPRILRRKELLKKIAMSSGSTAKGLVTSLKTSVSGRGYLLVHEPPHEATQVEIVLWTDRNFYRFMEAELKAKTIRNFPEKSIAHWRSFSTQVERSRVAALPLFSLWLIDKTSRHLLLTGEINSGSIYRVFCVPCENPDFMTLQIQHLVVENEDAPTLAIESPDYFLKDLCPDLVNSRPRYNPYVADEDLIYNRPTSGYCLAAKDLHCWRSRTVVDELKFLNKIASRFKDKKVRPALNP
jgi:hypothetical protein